MSRAVLFLLGALSTFVSPAAQPIAVLLDFKSVPEPSVVSVMTAEVHAVLESAQLNLRFLRLTDPRAFSAFKRIILVRFEGVCHSRSSVDPIQLDEPALLDHPALARTEVSGGRVLPYVRVFCNEVRAFVPRVGPHSPEVMYGRALGRVLVHELYHTLLSTREHAQTGLACATLSGRDLTRNDATLDTESLGQLRERWGEQQVAIRHDDGQAADAFGNLP